jgi:CheY-like chemotaxis protein
MAHLLSFFDPTPQLDAHQPTELPERPEPVRCINTAHKSALLVENNDSLKKLLRRYLDDEGYSVRIASDTDEGLRLYGDCAPFNVVLIEYDAPQRTGIQIDYCLPQTSGKTLASDILRVNPSQGIIFAASAYRSPDDLSLPQELKHIPVLIDISIFQLRTFLTTLEVRRALVALSVADNLRLKRAAAYLIRGLGRAAHNRTPDDLLGEAQLRTLIGASSTKEGRHWNPKIDLVQYLKWAMQSISFCWKQRSGDKETYLMSEVITFSPKGRESSCLETVASGEAGADRALTAKEEVARIFRMFTDDTDATQVLQGWYDDLKPNEIRQKYGLDEKRFAAAKKRIRTTTMSRRNGDGGREGHGV